MELEQRTRPEIASEQDQFDYFYDEIFSCPEEKQRNNWSVSWSDLMMTMFIFFAVMYIYQVGDKDLKFGFGPARSSLSEQGSGMVANISTQSKLLDVFDQTKLAIKDVLIDDNIMVDLVNGTAVRIILAGDFLFDPGRANLKLGAKYQLEQIAKALDKNGYMVNVSGHTDDTPSNSETYPTNWELSSHRAVMVVRYLTEVCGVDGNKIYTTSHSSHQPIRSNDTQYNRSLNRRVELILTKEQY